FPDAIQVRLARSSSYPLYPATIPVNARAGREIAVSIRNNAPEIRNFKVAMAAGGLEFSPASIDVAVGASAARDVSFRVFAGRATPGLHSGEVKLSGAASLAEPFLVVVIPPAREIAWAADGFFFLESASERASFLPGSWLEYIAKEQGQDRLTAPVTPFSPGPIAAEAGALSFAGGRTLHLADLQRLLPRKDTQRNAAPRRE
ncbi:MAG TPA: hypothetical protein VG345_02775, partial [Bryobacteraceae bacterium]|nr:hypothetical protein [Bryobacteraceae bacterium]